MSDLRNESYREAVAEMAEAFEATGEAETIRGDDRRAYDAFRQAERAYREAGDLEGVARAGTRKSRAWRDLTGEEPY